METVHEFYKDATVLITGGTGFLGKVLLEKLLRSFEAKKIILLIRSKHSEDPTQRLLKISKETIFGKLRDLNPNCFNKVLAVKVNYDSDDLGIAECDLKMITREVQIVFHAMAALNINEKLKNAININILGTRRVLDLVKQMQNLKAFVHVSTFYVQCHRASVEEKIDVPVINCQQLLDMTANLSIEQVEDIKEKLMDKMPNTYTLTKRYAEELVTNAVGKKLPAGIFRPPMLTSVYKEPLPGWTDNLNGPMSFSVAISKGFAHVLKCDGSKKSHTMPIDYCVNALLATAWDVSGRTRTDGDVIPVYNFVFNENNLTWREYFENLEKPNNEQPLENPMWHRFVFLCKTEFCFSLLFLLFHYVPGYLMDIWRLTIGKPRRYYQNYQMFKRFIHSVSIVSLNDWSFQNDNIVQLHKKLKELGVKNLEFHGKTIDWTNEYAKSYIPGLKKYFLKENMDNLSSLRGKYQRKKYLHEAVKFVLLGCCLSFVYLIIFQ